VKLDITPWISQSGQITAEISPELSNSEGNNEEGYPNVSSRTITTTVRLNDGETLVLGGLIKNQLSEDIKKVPFLGDIPFLGILFRRTSKTRVKSDLVIFITPHIIKQEEALDLGKELDDIRKRNRGIFERGFLGGTNIFKPSKTKKGTTESTPDTLSAPPKNKVEPGSAEKNEIQSAPVQTAPTATGDTTANAGPQ
jgi:type II secretory pathway component GspD/PulD (secretin)